MSEKNNIKSTQSAPSLTKNYPQFITKILLFSTFILALTYALFLLGKHIFWLSINPQNRDFGNIFSFLFQLVVQALLALSSIAAIKRRNKTALGFAIVPLLTYSILLFAPGTIIKGGLADGMTPTDSFLYITSFCFNVILFVLSIAVITIVTVKLVKNKKASQLNT